MNCHTAYHKWVLLRVLPGRGAAQFYCERCLAMTTRPMSDSSHNSSTSTRPDTNLYARNRNNTC